MADEQRKRRRILLDDEEEDEQNLMEEEMRIRRDNDDSSEVLSNPDELLTEEEDEGEGEDLMDNWKDDYAAAPELDYYDPSMLAADDDEDLNESYEKRVRDRMAAEEELDALDERRRAREEETDYNLERVNRFEQLELNEFDEMEEEQDGGAERPLNLEKFECPLREWIAEERTRREIKRRFRNFLITYYDGIEQVADWMRRHEGMDPKPPLPQGLSVRPPVYPYKIRAMCAANSSSLMMSYAHIARVQSLLAIWLTDVPRDMLELFDEVLKDVVYKEFQHYKKITNELHVRITDLPISDRLRNLRQADLNNLVRVAGVVTRRTGVFPQQLSVVYDCTVCGTSTGLLKQSGHEVRPDSCANCATRNSFKINTSRSIYGNYQKITLQETPGTVPAGRIPRYKDVILLGDLVDAARPGDEVDVTGIFTHAAQMLSNRSNGFPVFSTVIEANCVMKRHGVDGAISLPGGQLQWAEEDKRRILALSKDKQITKRILKSIAPSIYGHAHVKLAIAMALFGGCAKNGGETAAIQRVTGGQEISGGALGVSGGSGRGIGNHRVRGDINVLLLGDPGTAKSQVLKFVEKTAPRAVYTTGKGASAVGLTAGVHRDPMTKEWTLEGGALVLADKGVCLIDEFDKMNEQDRTSIHEAMEQQTISVSKAGIVTSLQARCSVIAAANPIGGRYDAAYAFSENVELTDPILSRFDILCVLQDTVDPVADEKLALFVANSHVRSHPDYNIAGADPSLMDIVGEEKSAHNYSTTADPFDLREPVVDDDGIEPIPQDLLRKYISYARSEIRPILHDVDVEKIALLYADLRAQSEQTGGVPIAVRHIESIVRMSEASARMHLRDAVRSDDVDLAIKVALESFLQAQKVSVRKALQKTFRKYITFGEDLNLLLMHQLQGLILDVEKYKLLTKDQSASTEVFIEALESRARALKVFNLEPFYQSQLFRANHLEVDKDRGVIRKFYVK